ncbi:MAG: ABC transporter ATP-binding protein [Gammaproteobacteria bacterium]|nr:ABC transporter ATP-binding protein [Gammaproteobacteria bacterium]
MLEVERLVRCYGSFVAVDDVSFSIGDREIVGLLGHNGAGKTTIMKMLSGYLEPDSGQIQLAGKALAANLKACQRQIGYLPENLPVYPELTVIDYLDYAAVLSGLSGVAKRQEVRRVMAATELHSKAGSVIGTLSRGFKQRVGVAQALLGRPQLLILDEPTNGLDPTQTEHMRDLIRDLSQAATVILSTHIMQEVSALCDRVLILRNGKLAVDERLADLRHSRHLALLTTLTEPALREALRPLDGVAGITLLPSGDGEGVSHYQLTLGAAGAASPPTASHSTAAGIARAVLEAGGELFALHPATRDLESLFREVNSGSLSNAA